MNHDRWRGLRIEAEGTGISRELSENINLLGEVLGRVVRDTAGDDLFDRAEELRRLCKQAATSDETEAREQAAGVIAGLTNDQIVWLLRTYTAFFHLANQAEQQEIVRINRERSMDGSRPESIDRAVGALHDAGFTLDQTLEILGGLCIEPTLTAHPTEARRRSILFKQRDISRILAELGDSPTQDEREEALETLYAQVTLLLATDEVRAERPTVEDEVAQGLYFLQNGIWEMIPLIHADLLRAIEDHFGERVWVEPVVRYRSWIGSDRDGNPNVTPEVTRQTIATQRQLAMEKQLEEVKELIRELSLSDRRSDVPPELYESLKKDEAEVALPEKTKRRYRYEPYRMKLAYIRKRLEESVEALEEGNASPYDYNGRRYAEDLDLLAHSLGKSGHQNVADHGRLARARSLARVFGFRLASLDVRQHSRVHEEALSELLRQAGVEEDYAGLEESAKVELLARELSNPRPLLPRSTEVGETVAEVLKTFEVIRDALRQEPGSIGSYIVSMTHEASDLLEPILLAKEVGLWHPATGAPIDFVPLFETIDDLELSGERTRALLNSPAYKPQVEARGGFQEIMLGYSDSNKDGGYWMANWALHKAQSDIAEACMEAGVDFRLFHGRGGTVGRGGGRASNAILSMPRKSLNRKIRVTEQGEVISFRYALTPLAHRHIEQIVHAMILAEVEEEAPVDPEPGLMEEIATSSMEAYRGLVDAPGMWEWYTAVTPIEQISRLPIASRPVSRGSGADVVFDSLRAIPWVFAWTQLRYLVPGWYGIGSAIEKIADGSPNRIALLGKLYREWGFFSAVVDNAAREMARARPEIAKRYVDLANAEGDLKDFHGVIVAEFEKTRDFILRMTGNEELLSQSPVIQKSIALRNPYTDVLNLLQVELMKRSRNPETEEEGQSLRSALFLSVNGIAAAMQSTG